MDLHDALLILRVYLVSSNLPAKAVKRAFCPKSLMFPFAGEAFFASRATAWQPTPDSIYIRKKKALV
jgi:hypothetical protein